MLNLAFHTHQYLCRLAQRGMPRRFDGLTPLAVLVCLLILGCSASEHPDMSRYEYRYMDGGFVAPYTTFPEGRERGEWQCFDEKTRATFDCTFVRGGWEQYKYIFRKRR